MRILKWKAIETRSATRCLSDSHRRQSATFLMAEARTSAEDPFPRRGPRRNRPAKTGQRLEPDGGFSVGDAFGAGSGTFSTTTFLGPVPLGLVSPSMGSRSSENWGSWGKNCKPLWENTCHAIAVRVAGGVCGGGYRGRVQAKE